MGYTALRWCAADGICVAKIPQDEDTSATIGCDMIRCAEPVQVNRRLEEHVKALLAHGGVDVNARGGDR